MVPSRLADITTLWTLLAKAHGEVGSEAQDAMEQLMRRYLGAVHRYLLAAVRDADVAQELTQEFAVRFVCGRFRGATPERGQFRKYLKASLFHLVDEYYVRRGREPRQLEAAEEPIAAEPAQAILAQDQRFIDCWRIELLNLCWRRLEAEQQRNGQPYFAVLRLRVDHPDARSAQLAELLAQSVGRPFNAAATRQALHRARQRFAELLFEETSLSLGTTACDEIEDELADLNLLKYCKPNLPRTGE